MSRLRDSIDIVAVFAPISSNDRDIAFMDTDSLQDMVELAAKSLVTGRLVATRVLLASSATFPVAAVRKGPSDQGLPFSKASRNQ